VESDPEQLLRRSSFWRSRPHARLEQNLDQPMLFHCPLLSDGHLLITQHLGLPVLDWCHAQGKQRLHLDHSLGGVWVAEVPGGWQLTITQEGPQVFLVLHHRERCLSATLHFRATSGTPSQVRLRLRQGETFRVLCASRAA